MNFDDNSLYNIKSSVDGKRYSLFELATWKNGFAFKKINFCETGVPVIKIAELNNGIGGTTAYTQQTFSEDVHLCKGDLLFSWSGNPQTSIDIFRFNLDEGWLNQHIFKVTPDEKTVDRDYFYFLMKNLKPHFTQIATNKQTTGLGHVTIADIKRMSVVIPSLDVQREIVSYIKPIYDKIVLNDKINNNLQQQAASIFTKWLSTCADASTIGDMSYNILDYSPVGSEQIRLLNSSDVTEGVFPIAPLVPNKDLKGHFKKRFKFGDILYSEIRPRNHHYGFVLFDASDYIASTRLMVIRAIENKVSPAMLYQYLLLPEVEAEFTLKTESRSGTFPQGNYADMASIRVPYSPTDSQVAISETLTQIRYTIAQNQLESQRLAELRDTLLPKLMSGELDVSAVEL